MDVMLKQVSQNGRWGVEVVSDGYSFGDGDVSQSPWTRGQYTCSLQAEVSKIGEVEGRDVFRAEPTDKDQWLVTGDDLEPLMGASMIIDMSLQGGDNITLLMVGEQAIVRSWGYKRRSSQIVFLDHGVETEIPASILLALGVLPDTPEPEPVPAPPPFDIEAADSGLKQSLAAAFAKARRGR